MAASDSHSPDQVPREGGRSTLARGALLERLDEEIGRAERHGTGLSCVLVMIENLEDMAREHGSDLPEQTLAYVANALSAELRRFDRIGRPGEGELLIVLPGADGPLGEIVARRVMERMRTIKLESRGARRPLEVSLGLAAWGADMRKEDLLARTRAAAGRGKGEEPVQAAEGERPTAHGIADAQAAAHVRVRGHSAVGRAAPS
jgi:diguanylate cyclase (GGDEF)-like protein